MAKTPFSVKILTPEGEVFADQVEMLSTQTTVGSIGILANHQPLLAMLEPTELRLYKNDSEVVRFAQGEGYLQVSDSGALLIVDEVVPPSDLDVADIEQRIQKDAGEHAQAPAGSEQARAAARHKKRYEKFLEIARG